MNWVAGFFLLISVSAFSNDIKDRCPLAGTYAGYARMENSPFKLPMVFNVAYYKEAGDYKAAFFVRLSLGGFVSHEYQTYSFTLDNFDSSNPVLDLNADQDVSLFSQFTSEDRHHIKGTLQSTRAGLISGNFELTYIPANLPAEEIASLTATIFPDAIVAPPLTGSYESQCPLQEGFQIEASRINGFMSADVSPFRGYLLTARFTSRNAKEIFRVSPPNGGQHKLPYGDNHWILRTMDSRRGDLEFDPFRGQMLLVNGLKRELCQIEEKGIRCGSCYFQRSQHPSSKGLLDLLVQSSLPTQKDFVGERSLMAAEAPIHSSSREEDAEGEYLGFIHYDNIDKKRAFSVRSSLTGKPNSEKIVGNRQVHLVMEKLFVSKLANGNWHRVFPYFLKPATLEGDSTGKLFHGHTHESAQITSWTKSHMSGVIYSHAYGRIGSFEVSRKGLHNQKEFEELQAHGCLDGLYHSRQMWSDGHAREASVSINVTPNTVFPNILFPYALTGFFGFRIVMPPNDASLVRPKEWNLVPIAEQAGGYDPFTGVGILRIGGDSVAFGKFEDSGLTLHYSSGTSFGETRPRHENRFFKKVVSIPK